MSATMTQRREHAMVQHHRDVPENYEHWSYWTCRCGREYASQWGWFTRTAAREAHRLHLIAVGASENA